MFAAQVGNRHPALRLAQYRHDLGFAKSALLHQNLLEHLAEKILLLKPLIRGEDYPGSASTTSTGTRRGTDGAEIWQSSLRQRKSWLTWMPAE
ncbi:hypothetical protein ABIA14_005399 [Sinorhizobium fredii]